MSEERWDARRFAGESFSNLELVKCSFHACVFDDCSFNNVVFKNCQIGFDSTYSRCAFESCRFGGKHASMSGGRFDDCSFRDLALRSASMEASFTRCRFSGVWESVFLHGANSPVGETILVEVDLAETEMRNVMFYGADTDSVVLPTQSVRVFANGDGGFTTSLSGLTASGSEPEHAGINSIAELYSGWDPVILCEDVLDEMLKPETRRRFEEVAEKWERRRSSSDA